jgi:hypothetical protein
MKKNRLLLAKYTGRRLPRAHDETILGIRLFQVAVCVKFSKIDHGIRLSNFLADCSLAQAHAGEHGGGEDCACRKLTRAYWRWSPDWATKNVPGDR